MGTIEEKLNALKATKAALKAAINGSGNTVGDKFSDYPVAVSDGKSIIASVVTAKGVQTAADATFAQIANNISQIESISDIKKEFKSGGSATIFTNYPINTFAFVAINSNYGDFGSLDLSRGDCIFQFCTNDQTYAMNSNGGTMYTLEMTSLTTIVQTGAIRLIGRSSIGKEYVVFYA